METNIDIVTYSGVNRSTRAQAGVIGFINQPKTQLLTAHIRAKK